MADVSDQATALEEQQLQDALVAQHTAAQNATRYNPQGFCLNVKCSDEFEGEDAAMRLFCGPKCAAAHTLQQQLRK